MLIKITLVALMCSIWVHVNISKHIPTKSVYQNITR